MKLPLSWLKDYVDIGDVTPQELSDKLLSIGFEVEEIIAPRNFASDIFLPSGKTAPTVATGT